MNDGSAEAFDHALERRFGGLAPCGAAGNCVSDVACMVDSLFTLCTWPSMVVRTKPTTKIPMLSAISWRY